MRTRPEDILGAHISHYHLTHIIGKGGMGAVFLGHDLEQPDHYVAIKILVLPWQATEEERERFRKRFAREATLLRHQLRDPRILPVLESGEFEGEPYMVLPFIGAVIEGTPRSQTLEQRIAQANASNAPIPLREVASIFKQIAGALQTAHLMGVIHRDIKPANILLDPQGQVYLSDFSIAGLFQQARTNLTRTGAAPGTTEYMAPEQREWGEARPASDQYSLAAVLYEMITGKSVYDVIRATHGRLTAPRTLRPEVSEDAEATIMQALAREPHDRFPNVARFADAFEQGLHSQQASRDHPEPEELLPSDKDATSPQIRADPLPGRPRPTLVMTLAALLAVFLLVVVVLYSVGVILHPSTAHGPGRGVTPPAGHAGARTTPSQPPIAGAATTTPQGTASTPTPYPTATPIPYPTATPTPYPTETPTPYPTATSAPQGYLAIDGWLGVASYGPCGVGLGFNLTWNLSNPGGQAITWDAVWSGGDQVSVNGPNQGTLNPGQTASVNAGFLIDSASPTFTMYFYQDGGTTLVGSAQLNCT